MSVSVTKQWVDDMARERQEILRKLARQTDEIARLRAALKPFAEFARKFDARPIHLGDALYSIHGGDGVTKDGATLRLSDCRAALKAMG
jgi:hypothetical protein